MRKIFLLAILVFLGMVGYSQTNDTISSPLEKFFQENYDSTIIHGSYNTYNNPVFIMGKKEDTIYYYYYNNKLEFPSKNIGPYNSKLYDKFISKYIDGLRKSRKSKMDINDSFFWVLTETSKNSLWEKIQSENLWIFIDDENEEMKFDFSTVLDGHNSYFYLITKDKVINLSYFVPDLFPRIPDNHIRNRIVDVDKLIFNFYRQKIPYLIQ